MVTYEYARMSNGKFLAYCEDNIANVKMIVIGSSHSIICHNFSVLLKRNRKDRFASPRRFIQAEAANPDLIAKFGDNRGRGGILNEDNDKIVTVREKREQVQLENTAKQERANSLIEQDDLEKQFDEFITKTDDKGNICIYGIKLVKTYKCSKQF